MILVKVKIHNIVRHIIFSDGSVVVCLMMEKVGGSCQYGWSLN